MLIERVPTACDEPRSRVADYFRLVAGDRVNSQETAVQETDLGTRLVASRVVDQLFRAIGDWVRPAWQGQGSVVREEGRVRVSSGLLRASCCQPAALDYTVVYSLEPQSAQLALSARTEALLRSRLLCAPVGCGDLSSGVWFTQGGVVLGAEAPNDILQRLAGHRILLPNAQDAAAYLAMHPQLAQLLPNIGAQVRQAFGSQVELSLELYKDPEIDDRYLTLYVRKEKYEPDILDRLQSVSERFNHRLEEVPGYLLLATDFSRPRGSHAV